MITHEELKSLLDYDPATGIFTWKSDERPGGYRNPEGHNQVKAGDRAGWVDLTQGGNGYRFIEISRRKYKAANLAWFYIKGKWPKKVLDHMNRDSVDDSFNNLRECTKPQNGANMSMRKDNTSGVRGVNWNKRMQKWHARIMHEGKSIHLGLFDTLEAAKRVREERALSLFGDFNPQ